MSKILEANCALGVVTVDGIPVAAADIMTEGMGASSGILIMDEDEVKYLTSNASNLKTTIEKLSSSLTTIATALTSIAAGMLGPATAPPPTLPANITTLLTTVAELTVLKETLK